MAACMYPLKNKYWREGGTEGGDKAENILGLICKEVGVAMPKLVEDDGDVVGRTRLLAKLRG